MKVVPNVSDVPGVIPERVADSSSATIASSNSASNLITLISAPVSIKKCACPDHNLFPDILTTDDSLCTDKITEFALGFSLLCDARLT